MKITEQIINNLYLQAEKHVREHDCSAKPYKSGKKLIEVLEKYQPAKVLEIGTGFGLTTALIALSCPNAEIDSLEKDLVHIEFAKEFLTEQKVINRVKLIDEAAEYYFESLESRTFDFILFDGFQIHYEFLPHYERLLKPGGILFLANNHLKSRTSNQFFEELGNKNIWKILEKFDDTTLIERTS